MESKTDKVGVDKDLDQKFDEIGKLISAYRSSNFSKEELENQGNRAVKIVGGLTSIMKYEPLTPESQLSRRVCEVVDNINKDELGTSSIWDFSCTYGDKYNEPLMSFLKELAIRGLVPQIDKIFRCRLSWWPSSSVSFVKRHI